MPTLDELDELYRMYGKQMVDLEILQGKINITKQRIQGILNANSAATQQG